MYLKLDFELYEKICNTTMTDYEAVGEFLPADSIISILEDLLFEIGVKNEQLEDMKKDIEENYKPIPPEKEYGVDEKDFL